MTGETEEVVESSTDSRELGRFRREVRAWCAEHVPPDWRASQTGVTDAEFVRFQKQWFAELHSAGFAVPHWPAEWAGGARTRGVDPAAPALSVAEQVVLYQELAAHDAPRLVLAFVGIHHAASTLLVAGTDEQRQRHLPAILDGEIWVQGFSEPEAGSDLASLRTTARRVGDDFVVSGQKLWASGGLHADWCLLLARTDPEAPKRKGISYFLLDMTSPGIEVRPIRNAIGDSHFCEIFLDDVVVPAANLVGQENAGWQVAQATLGAERGMTMLELAERLGNAGFRWLVEAAPTDDPVVADRLAQFEIEIAGLRGMCRRVVEKGADGPADASIVKLYYSELLQRLTDFGAEIGGTGAHTVLAKPLSSGWESGSWVLDFIGSWEWTIPGGASEIQRTIIAERGLGLPREPSVA
ncbi:acyl-CoA dehydrogenase family protein [Mycobacterium sp. Y57]|uniref:acyl-CoA dehydrogenase family protein n=1 Tax=Mycolicibacterium xanthum TaxID=2796469 RepID=UPI001C865377|nr:acyl-CoA dehydrogenase family protein [Mycolicibacterium xanthum]MBX7433840.1 acyl-CoA dehydrogenase family protein [Mycolicibacterium xanthum]